MSSESVVAGFVEEFGKGTGTTAKSEILYGELSLVRGCDLSAMQVPGTGHRQN